MGFILWIYIIKTVLTHMTAENDYAANAIPYFFMIGPPGENTAVSLLKVF